MRETSMVPAALGALLLAFATAPGNHAAAEGGSIQEASGSANGGCPVLESADWIAWVASPPGSSVPSLHLAGQVVLPTPGFTVQGRLAALDRRQPPSQRVVLDFMAPSGVVTQVLSTEDVQLSFPALANTYRSVIVVCGDTTIGEITEVGTMR